MMWANDALCCADDARLDAEDGRVGQDMLTVLKSRAAAEEAARSPPAPDQCQVDEEQPDQSSGSRPPAKLDGPVPVEAVPAGSPLDRAMKFAQKFTLVRASFAFMPLMADFDMLSDMFTFVYVYLMRGYYKSAALMWFFVNTSWRFNMCFAVLHPKPTLRNIAILYTPFLLLPYFAEIRKGEAVDSDEPAAGSAAAAGQADLEQIAITVPYGAVPGQQLKATTPDGRAVMMTVPRESPRARGCPFRGLNLAW